MFNLSNSGNSDDVTTNHCRTDTFKHSFFPWTILEWNSKDLTLSKHSFKIFRNYFRKVIRPSPNLVYDIRNQLGLRLLTRLRLGLSHLNKYKLNHNFENSGNPPCTCSLEIDLANITFFLHCIHFNNIQRALLNELKSLDGNILKLSDVNLT